MTIRYSWLLAVCLFSSVQLISAQTPLAEAPRRADISPAWPGCEPKLTDCTKSRLADFIAANLQIPPEAKAQSAGGVVVMEFVVEKSGMIGEVKPMQDPGFGLGVEATRVINLMKTKKIKWTPAEDDGKKIAFRYVTPVSFNLVLAPKEKSTSPDASIGSAELVYDMAETMPRFQGCDGTGSDSVDCTFTKMLNHIKTTLTYPEEALKNRVAGQVVVQFVIDKTGAVTQTEVLQGIGFGCDDEAKRVVSNMPAWTPGTQGGQPVAVRMKLPILFQLPKEKD